ncbi:lipopolysaccharide biosynthesis protein [Burkholderia sp. NRF60-BP8]|uniref:lipopolysaccharide biosynthesis protein n=1 Tax=Burkholderia sp. NRF60-BP8 TaxID=1637853 RepID=UPI00075EFC78|nr:oligosaccharide flippase family protein [Burkholderia sp. NRF60-BP8]AOI77005.1 polysaccharide biosynthesis protein [Burkholderia sp. NRF60-BP8]KVA04113.1 polysaccharide biosynthesis protein [Burkholderia sp. NRF60-BP8]
MSAAWSRLMLRVAALGLKFMLTIVVARTLGFDAVAVYGVALAVSVVASKVLGLGFSTEINRRLAGPDPRDAVRTCVRLSVLYALVYALLCGAAALPVGAWGAAHVDALAVARLLPVVLVACAEHAALEVNTWLFSLHRARAASWLLFVRTGAWAGVAIAALALRTIDSIDGLFAIWIAADVFVVAAGWVLIAGAARRLPAMPALSATRVRLAAVWRDGAPFFVALLLLSVLQYLERFVASAQLDAEELGRYVFVWSIANAIQTVASATVVAVAAPRLVCALDRSRAAAPAFRAELARALRASLLLTSSAALAIAAVHPWLFRLAHAGNEAPSSAILAVLLLSFVLRAAADVLWAAAVALRAGRTVACVIAVLTLACVPMSIALVQDQHALGAAFAHLVASIAVIAWLAWIVTSRAQAARGKRCGAGDAA